MLYLVRPRKRKKAKTVKFDHQSKWIPGQQVIGKRVPVEMSGTFVKSYYTLNGSYRNYAHIIKCDKDGKERSFQHIVAIN